MPLRRRSSNGSETFAKRFVQYGLISRYSIFLLPAMICVSHPRSMVAVIRSCFSFFIGLPRIASDVARVYLAVSWNS